MIGQFEQCEPVFSNPVCIDFARAAIVTGLRGASGDFTIASAGSNWTCAFVIAARNAAHAAVCAGIGHARSHFALRPAEPVYTIAFRNAFDSVVHNLARASVLTRINGAGAHVTFVSAKSSHAATQVSPKAMVDAASAQILTRFVRARSRRAM